MAPPSGAIELVDDDRRVDRLWVLLARGDLPAAELVAARVEQPELARRAWLDVLAAREGRPRALERAWELGGWWPARYLASVEAAHDVLAGVGVGGVLPRLEDARRSGAAGRRAAVASSLLGARPGGAEALAVLAETWLAQGRLQALTELLDDAPPSARLDLTRRRLDVARGRHAAAARGLLDDWARDRITPDGLQLLQAVLFVLPREDLQGRALDLAAHDEAPGPEHERARRRLLASLLVQDGRVAEGLALLEGLAPLDPVEVAAVGRLRARIDPDAPAIGPEARLDASRDRPDRDELRWLRLLHEWDLAARHSYRAAWAEGAEIDLDGFVARLDEAAAVVEGAPRLADLPRRDFGMFGTMLDTGPLREALPEAFVLGGAGFLQPPELTTYDLVERTRVERADELVDGLPVAYERNLVRRLRVPGYLASRGARFAGVGLVDTVFLDLDEADRQAMPPLDAGLAPEVAARPAHDREGRRDLSEPLDVAARVMHAARVDAGDAWGPRVLQVLDIHEGRHIIDVQRFLEGGFGWQILDVVAAGLLPSSVRAELEYRAQLDALRLADDPRIAMAQALAYLPVEGVARGSEHAVGYERLVREVVAALDGGDWPGARPLDELGLDPGRVLVQQLQHVDAEVLRAVAESLWD